MLTLLVNLTDYKANKNKKHTGVSPPGGTELPLLGVRILDNIEAE